MQNFYSLTSQLMPESENNYITESIAESFAETMAGSTTETISKILNDKELYQLCKKYGAQALQARRKFAGLLPEVLKRRLFERKSFNSIYEFAAKLAGMRKKQVDIYIRLEQRFEKMPVLHEALVKGEISANKLVRVASIATSENQEELRKKMEILSSRALEVFVKDKKCEIQKTEESQIQNDIKNNQELKINQVCRQANGIGKPINEQKYLHVQTTILDENIHEINERKYVPTLNLDQDIEKELFEMQGKGIDINAFLRQCLQKRKEKIAQQKEQLAQKIAHKEEEKDLIGMPISRHIPAKIKNIIIKEFGTKCAHANCKNSAQQIHHRKQFAVFNTHDPRFLQPLCAAHHELARAVAAP